MSLLVSLRTVGTEPLAFALAPDEAARAAIASRLRIEAIDTLTCQFTLHRDRRSDRVQADGRITAQVIQLDSLTLDPFPADITEAFQLRFMPEAELPELVDPTDPVDDIGITADRVDLEELMIQQLALALDPYPHA